MQLLSNKKLNKKLQVQKAEKETFERHVTVAGEECLQTKLY